MFHSFKFKEFFDIFFAIIDLIDYKFSKNVTKVSILFP